MSNCIGKTVASKVSYNKIVKDTAEVAFTIMEDIDACAKIITKKYVDWGSITKDGTKESQNSSFNPIWRKHSIPDDLLNICESFGCKNTGTLGISPVTTSDLGGYATFTSASDATEYMAGVMYFYVQGSINKVQVTISDIKDTTMENADVYTVDIDKTNEWMPVSIDLSVAPTKTVGEGWQASDSGVRVEIANLDGIGLGVSSISFFDSIEDLEGNEAIRLGCLTGVEGEDTIDALEEACMGAQYDETSPSIERTITFKTWTPNALLLNPFIHKSDETEGWFFQTVKKTIPSSKEIHLSDLYTEECGHTYVAFDDTCNITDSVLKRVNSPNKMNLNENQFQLITNKQNPTFTENGGVLYFDESLVGKTVLISYPKEALEVETYVATTTGINNRRVKMAYSKTISDGVAEMFEYRNVLITSFPMTLSSDDSELEVTISIQKDSNNTYYTQKRINSEAYLL